MDDVLIHNQCAQEQIDPVFLPMIEAAHAGMLECCGERLRELRLQGSIARGDARAGHSDLDMIALLSTPPTASETRCLADLEKVLGSGTCLVSRFDLEAFDANALLPFRRFVLASDSLCIRGDDSLSTPVQAMERFALATLVTPDSATMLPDYLHWAEELGTADNSERLFASRIIGKDLLKILRGVLLLRGAPYEVAIPRIAAQVPLFAPEAIGVAESLFGLYAEPTPSSETIRQVTGSAVNMLEALPELGSLHVLEK